jgi:probable phosphoglycerate mutase
MELIIVRHAEPNYEIDSLTEKGWKEAKLLSHRTTKWDIRDIYCSPLGRAKDTASFTLKALGRDASAMVRPGTAICLCSTLCAE